MMQNLKNLKILVKAKKKEIDVEIEYEFRQKFEKVCGISSFSSAEEKYEGKIYYVKIDSNVQYLLYLFVSKRSHNNSTYGLSLGINKHIYGSDADSIVHKINDWIYKRYNLMCDTDYLYNKKKCILILLATKHKQFFGLPLDITKIITNKILFFFLKK